MRVKAGKCVRSNMDVYSVGVGASWTSRRTATSTATLSTTGRLQLLTVPKASVTIDGHGSNPSTSVSKL
jgi:hypothetical protein